VAKFGPMSETSFRTAVDSVELVSKALATTPVEGAKLAKEAYQGLLLDTKDLDETLLNVAEDAIDMRVGLDEHVSSVLHMTEKYRLFGFNMEEISEKVRTYANLLGLTYKEASNLTDGLTKGFTDLSVESALLISTIMRDDPIFSRLIRDFEGSGNIFGFVGQMRNLLMHNTQASVNLIEGVFSFVQDIIGTRDPMALAAALTSSDIGGIFRSILGLSNEMIYRIAEELDRSGGKLIGGSKSAIEKILGEAGEGIESRIKSQKEIFEEFLHSNKEINTRYEETIDKFIVLRTRFINDISPTIKEVGDNLATKLEQPVNTMANWYIRVSGKFGEMLSGLAEMLEKNNPLSWWDKVKGWVANLISSHPIIQGIVAALGTVGGGIVGGAIGSPLEVGGIVVGGGVGAVGGAMGARKLVDWAEQYKQQGGELSNFSEKFSKLAKEANEMERKLKGKGHEGGKIESTGLYQLEKGEYVLTEQEYDMVNSLLNKMMQKQVTVNVGIPAGLNTELKGTKQEGGRVAETGLYQLEKGEYVLTEQERNMMNNLLGRIVEKQSNKVQFWEKYVEDFKEYSKKFDDLHETVKEMKEQVRINVDKIFNWNPLLYLISGAMGGAVGGSVFGNVSGGEMGSEEIVLPGMGEVNVEVGTGGVVHYIRRPGATFASPAGVVATMAQMSVGMETVREGTELSKPCASFVSEILLQAGVPIAGAEGTHELMAQLDELVKQGKASKFTKSDGTLGLLPGDIVFVKGVSGPLGHVGIMGTRGLFINDPGASKLISAQTRKGDATVYRLSENLQLGPSVDFGGAEIIANKNTDFSITGHSPVKMKLEEPALLVHQDYGAKLDISAMGSGPTFNFYFDGIIAFSPETAPEFQRALEAAFSNYMHTISRHWRNMATGDMV